MTDAAVCQCGHPKRYHDPDCIECRIHDGLCFVFCADVNRPDRGAGTPHDLTEYVPGCFRCDLSRDEVTLADVMVADQGIGELADLLAAGLEAQNDADRYDSPWVSDETCMPGFVQVDGKIDLAALAAVLMAAGWEKR